MAAAPTTTPIASSLKTDLKQIAAVRLRVLTHDSLPKHGPGRAGNGNFVLTDFTVTRRRQGAADSTSAYADHEQPSYPVAGRDRRRSEDAAGRSTSATARRPR